MDDEQPWKKHKQLGYGVTLDCSHPGRAKQFKVRLRLRSQMLNVGRFEDAHTARLAYDQIITGLGLCKPTNYRPGSYPLDNPEVEAKLQQFLDANPEMAAAAAAVVNGRIGASSASAPASAAAAKPQQPQPDRQHAPAAAAAAAAAAAGLIDLFVACAAAAPALAASAVREGVQMHAAASAATAAARLPAAAAAGASCHANPDPFAHPASALTWQRSVAGSSVSTAFSSAPSSRASSEQPCCSNGQQPSVCEDVLGGSSSISSSEGSGRAMLQQLLQHLANSATLLSECAAQNMAHAEASGQAGHSEPSTTTAAGRQPASPSPGSAFHTYQPPAAGVASQAHGQHSCTAAAGLLPEAPALQLGCDEQPWAQQEQLQQRQQQLQQQQQLACIHSLLGLPAVVPSDSMAQPSPVASPSAAADAAAADAAPVQTRASATEIAAAAKEVTALEILAAWAAAQADAHDRESALEDAAEYAAAPV